MTLSAKWTAVSFLGVTALAAGSFAFAAGCTVTSGNPDDIEGGAGTNTDSSTTPVDGSKPDSSVVNACPANTKQKGDIVDATCQRKLSEVCCAELTACFNIVPDGSGGGPTDDCNLFADCLTDCAKPAADGGVPSQAEIAKCQTDICEVGAPKSVQDAYDAITTCATTKANIDCQ